MLPRKNRLKKDNDFKRLFRTGALVRGNILDLRQADSSALNSRLAIVVGKKVSPKATVRNRIRRQTSSAAEIFFDRLQSRRDILIIAKPLIINWAKEEIGKNVEQIFKKAGLID